MPTTKPKIIVLIPTKNRKSNYLRTTINSVMEQATRFHHDVEIVVSDLSEESFQKKNEQAIVQLTKKFPHVPIHYYGPEQPEPIRNALQGFKPLQKNTYNHLVPTDGAHGANRNRLALLATYHGGKDAVYLHLDDDSPLMMLDTSGKKVVLKRNPHDVIGSFVFHHHKTQERFKDLAERGHLVGFGGIITGIPEAYISGAKKKIKLTLPQALEKHRKYKLMNEMGHGFPRTLSFQGMTFPYRPHGRNSDTLQARGKAHFTSAGNIPDGPVVVHIGTTGFQPKKEHPKWPSSRNINPIHHHVWKDLIHRMAEQRRK
jgi:glycosyltransferase involved in cell wall biosynthesis